VSSFRDGAKHQTRNLEILRCAIAHYSSMLRIAPGMTDSFSMSRMAYAAGTGSAVTDLIFSIAKREVTFFSGTALISFL